jgi:hypothetical protein
MIFNYECIHRKLSVSTATSHASKRTPAHTLPTKDTDNLSIVTLNNSEISKPTPQKPLFGKLGAKQSKLGFTKVSTSEYDAQKAKAFEAVWKHAKQLGVQAALDKEKQEATRRKQDAARSRKLYWKKRGAQPEEAEADVSLLQEQGERGNMKRRPAQVLVCCVQREIACSVI